MTDVEIRYRIWSDENGHYHEIESRVDPDSAWTPWEERSFGTVKGRDRHLRKAIKNIRAHLEHEEVKSAAPWHLWLAD